MPARTVASILLVAALHALPAYATDLPEQLREEAGYIVTGPVRAVYVRHRQSEEGIDGIFIAEVEVRSAEKGELENWATVPVRYWARLRTDRPPETCSPTSYDPRPRIGDVVRAHFNRTPYGFQVVPPNGFEILERASDPEPSVLLTDTKTPGDFRAAARQAGPAPKELDARGGGELLPRRSWWIPLAACVVGALIGLPIGRATKSRVPDQS